MNHIQEITVLIINYKTEDLTRVCVESLLAVYPTVNLLLIDNGSKDGSARDISDLAASHSNITCILNIENLYHGPAMDQGIKHSHTPYVLTLDSDCHIFRGGFLELMLDQLISGNYYAIGHLEHKNLFGYNIDSKSRWAINYIHPYAMLLDKEKYFKLPAFFHHGAPCIRNMKAAHALGVEVTNFDIGDYVYHIGQGTCSRYGYGLGLDTSLRYLINRALERVMNYES